jgi:Asp-tRNA(Asn)/Glu-tRNA(Gln) amidotransferase A subunit family amidase
LPAISIPSITVGNLPIGIEIFGDKYEDLFIIYVSKTLKEERIL